MEGALPGGSATQNREDPILASKQDLDFVRHVRPAEPPPGSRRTPKERPGFDRLRRVFLEGVSHQIGLARDSGYSYPRTRYTVRDGERQPEVIYVTPAPWWFEEGGVLYLRLNFGERRMLLPGKNPVIRVGNRRALLPTLESLHVLVEQGAMDDVIEGMVIQSR